MGPDRRRKSTKSAPTSTQTDDDDLDHRGRPGKFNDKQKKWFQICDPLYDRKVSPFNGKKEDDADLKAWIENNWKLFKNEFKDIFASSDLTEKQWEKAFKGRYKNRYYNTLKKKGTKYDPASILRLLHTPTQTGYHKFVKAHSEEVATSTKALHAEVGNVGKEEADTTRFDVGTFQKDMGAKWRELSKDEKAEWEEMDLATVIDGDEVYQNQDGLMSFVNDLLHASQGFGEKQAGDCAHLLISTFRDKDGLLQNKVIIVEGKLKGAVPMFTSLSDFRSVFMPKWDRYTAQAIPDTLKEMLALDVTKSKPDEVPPPLLKDTADEEEEDRLTPADIREMLEIHFIELWAYAQTDSNKVLPWEDVIQNPEMYIQTSFLPSSIPFNHPRNIDRSQLYPMREAILSHQQVHPLEPSILFVDTSISRESSTTTRNDAVDVNTQAEARLDARPSMETPSARNDAPLGLQDIVANGAGTPQDESSAMTPQVAHSFIAHEHSYIDDDDEESASHDSGEDEDRRIVDPHEAPRRVFMPFEVPEIVVPQPSQPQSPCKQPRVTNDRRQEAEGAHEGGALLSPSRIATPSVLRTQNPTTHSAGSQDEREGRRGKNTTRTTPRTQSSTKQSAGTQDTEKRDEPYSTSVMPYGLRSRSPTKISPAKTSGASQARLASLMDADVEAVPPSPSPLGKKARTEVLEFKVQGDTEINAPSSAPSILPAARAPDIENGDDEVAIPAREKRKWLKKKLVDSSPSHPQQGSIEQTASVIEGGQDNAEAGTTGNAEGEEARPKKKARSSKAADTSIPGPSIQNQQTGSAIGSTVVKRQRKITERAKNSGLSLYKNKKPK